MGEFPGARRNGHRIRTITIGVADRVVECAWCRLTLSFDDNHAQLVPDLLASHWYDGHGVVAWRDEAAAARRRLFEGGYGLTLKELYRRTG
jgi:hypothetical protein